MHGKLEANSSTPREIVGSDGMARKNEDALRAAMQSHTYDELATVAGGSVSLHGRWFGESADVLARALACLGLKVVPAHKFCVPRETYLAYMQLAEEHVLANRRRRMEVERAEALLFEDPE